MTNLLTNDTSVNSLKSRWAGSLSLALAYTCFVMLGAVAANAQSPEAGGAGAYQAEKTVADYTKNAQQSNAGDFDYADNSLRVEVWVDKPQTEIYRKGENLSVGVQTNQDAYAVVYRIDTEGLVSVLWPRSRFDDGFIFGGHEYELPVSGARQLRVSTLEGEGVVEAIASRYPFDLRALELDFHHEHAAEQYNFQVAGDPFLAMNEVNFAVTGLEDSADYVVTNYVSYYVHQAVDHPRYLCSQCHLADDVAYDPYQDTCTLDIEYDYSWYNNWYDSYGYYPVYGNPVYVYVDPWTMNPWVNYWYQPYYSCAPWNGWGWGWGACYSWNYSPYYWGNSMTAYDRGYVRYRPLDRSGGNGADGRVTKHREYTRGSAMVRKNSPSDRDRSTMTARTGRSSSGKKPVTVAGRSGGRDVSYRGAQAETRNRTSFDQVVTRGQSGLRIRETGRTQTSSRGGSTAAVARKRHTAGGDGQRAGLVPVNRGSSFDNTNWRGTTRIGGTDHSLGSTGRTSGSSNRGSSAAGSSRSRNSSGGKAVQPRKRSTRVWTAPTGRTGTSSRARSGAVNTRRGRTTGHSKGTSVKQSKPAQQKSSSSRSGSTVRTKSSSKGGTSSKSSGGSRSSGSSRGSSGGSSRSSGGSRSGTSRR